MMTHAAWAVERIAPPQKPKGAYVRSLQVPENVNPIVKLIFTEMNRQRVSVAQMSERSGIHRDTLRDWRTRTVPSLNNVQAALEVLGIELMPVVRDAGV
jgi:lambda repressor-like predicted transcriptional regulator